MCNSPGIMKFSSHQNISPRSGSSEMESVTCATGHFPNSSHNCAWCGVINHDRMTTLTLQTKYDTTLPSGYPKFAYPLEISFWTRNFFHTWSDTSRPLRHRQRNDRLSPRCCLPWRHHGVTWITCSPLWRSLINRILKSLSSQNNTFFIATTSVVKDAADDTDCQGLRRQWYYLRFYVRRTMPPTKMNVCLVKACRID